MTAVFAAEILPGEARRYGVPGVLPEPEDVLGPQAFRLARAVCDWPFVRAATPRRWGKSRLAAWAAARFALSGGCVLVVTASHDRRRHFCRQAADMLGATWRRLEESRRLTVVNGALPLYHHQSSRYDGVVFDDACLDDRVDADREAIWVRELSPHIRRVLSLATPYPVGRPVPQGDGWHDAVPPACPGGTARLSQGGVFDVLLPLS